MSDGGRSQRLAELWHDRFSEVPWDCENDVRPGNDEVEEWREWHERETTPDQSRIENYLARLPLRGLFILHVGIGNSQLAARFSNDAAYIVGTTISMSEKQHGDQLLLKNYDIYVHNKYAIEPLDSSIQRFDIIIDNNPSSYCCCWRHFAIMMLHYKAMLARAGMVLTEKRGLGWVVSAPGAASRWKFTYDDWEAIGSVLELWATRINDSVYALMPMGAQLPVPVGECSFRQSVGKKLLRLGRSILKPHRCAVPSGCIPIRV